MSESRTKYVRMEKCQWKDRDYYRFDFPPIYYDSLEEAQAHEDPRPEVREIQVIVAFNPADLDNLGDVRQ